MAVVVAVAAVVVAVVVVAVVVVVTMMTVVVIVGVVVSMERGRGRVRCLERKEQQSRTAKEVRGITLLSSRSTRCFFTLLEIRCVWIYDASVQYL